MSMIDWDAAFAAFRQSGLSKVAFHRTRLIEFSKEGRIPGLKYFYQKIRELESAKAREAEAASAASKAASNEAPISVQSAGRKVFIARELPQSASRRPRISHCRRSAGAAPGGKLVLVKLPNGIELRFRTDSPETLAMQMMAAGGFAE